MRLLSRLPLAGALSAILALSACVDLAPSYQRPDAPVAAAWPEGAASSPAPAGPRDATDIGWRDCWRRPKFDPLVRLVPTEI